MPLLGAMGELERAHLHRARRRLAACGLHPRMRHVRVLHAPWFFRLPGLRRFAGYEIGPLILVERPLDAVSNHLVTHELCQLWQDQRRRVYMLRSLLTPTPAGLDADAPVRPRPQPAAAIPRRGTGEVCMTDVVVWP